MLRVSKLVNHFGPDSQVSNFDIGVSRVDNVWMYVSGRIISSVASSGLWKLGEPDSDSDCAVFRRFNGTNEYLYGMADTGCDNTVGIVCEKI